MLPHPISDTSAYGKLFIGSYKDGNEIDETMYPDTRRVLLEIVESRSERQLEDLGVNWSLSQHALDKIRILTKSVLGYYKDDR
ncbi:hypothetical protein P3T73_10025 [Kiritimatiellota bacterium B12222]|nr:hypothetical protein P3T73_10025 [Kiritimatiellota bacterium B12222]